MDVRLIVLDLDETVLTKQLEIPADTAAAIKAAEAAGVTVTLATGRMFASARPYAEQLGITTPFITYNGALITEPDGTVLHADSVSKDVVMELLPLAAGAGVTVNLYLDDRLYVAEINEAVEYYISVARVEAHVVGDLAAFVDALPEDAGLHKVLIVLEADKAPAMRQVLQERFGQILEIVPSQPRFLELTAKGVSKGRALMNLAARLGVPLQHVMAVGDNFNDTAMLETAGIGVAMGTAPAEVRVVADAVVGSADEAGVAEAIERYVLDPVAR